MPPAGKYATTPAYYPQGSAPVPVPEEEEYVPPPEPYGPPPDQGYTAQTTASQPGPPPQPDYIPTTQSAPAAPLPQSPSMAGPAPAPAPQMQYGAVAPHDDNIVQTSYPASGDTATYRRIPPAGSTYPVRENPTGVPPRDWEKLQEFYARGAYPDIEPRFLGEGPLGGGPPKGPNSRYVPESTYNRIVMPFFKGEGNMGYHDPLTPGYEDTRPVPGVGGYIPGPNETTPYTTFVPVQESPYTPAQTERMESAMRASGNDNMIPPPGYGPEMWKPKGKSISSYWYDRATQPKEVRPHGAGYAGEITPDQLSYDNPTTSPLAPDYANYDTLAAMERRRQERRLRGLFGSG